ncbi:hypothetical protein FOA52_015431 [Chlamydomonas sp. UWO 241]|nr:hypothetical protein FOA52_015431 [Chlamydomonas sp. UWO 241]
MSAKFQKAQKGKRWQERSTFPASWLAQLEAARSAAAEVTPLRAVVEELDAFVQGSKGASQQHADELKGVVNALVKGMEQEVTPGDADSARVCLALALELVFMDNSRPMHRQLLSAVNKMHPSAQDLAGQAVAARIQAELAAYDAAAPRLAKKTATVEHVVLGQALTSLLWLPQFHEWVRPVAVGVVRVMAGCISSVVGAAGSGAHVAPALMQEVQDAISSLYYIVSRHGADIAAAPGGEDALHLAASAMLCAMQGPGLVREALASAASVVWVSVLVPGGLAPPAAAALLAEGLFLGEGQAGAGASIRWAGGDSGRTHSGGAGGGGGGGDNEPPPVARCAVDTLLRSASGAATGAASGSGGSGGGLAHELRRCSIVGKICGLKGLVTALPLAASCATLALRGARGAEPVPFCFLMDGVLAHACALVLDAPDGHIKFHAACVVNTSLQQAAAAWRKAGRAGADADAAGAATAATAAATPADATGDTGDDAGDAGMPGPGVELAAPDAWRPPSLGAALLRSVMQVVWANLEEPLAQTARQIHEAFDALLELLKLQQQHGHGHGSGAEGGGDFLGATCRQMLSFPCTRKGRYLPLASLVRGLGASQLLSLRPGLVRETLVAMGDDMVASAAATFLRTLLLALRAECAAEGRVRGEGAAPPRAPRRSGGGGASDAAAGSSDAAATAAAANGGAAATAAAAGASGGAAGDAHGSSGAGADAAAARWQAAWLPQLMGVLGGGDGDKLRAVVATHALPVVLSIEPACLLDMLREAAPAAAAAVAEAAAAATAAEGVVAVGGAAGGAAAEPAAAVAGDAGPHALVLLLKAARSLQLLGDLDAIAAHGGPSLRGLDLGSALSCAITHASEAVRLDTLELACLSPKFSEPPGRLELGLVTTWLQLSLRNTSVGQRNKAVTVITKLMQRIRVASGSLLHRAAALAGAASDGAPGSAPAAQRLPVSVTRQRPGPAPVLDFSSSGDAADGSGGGGGPADSAALAAMLMREAAQIEAMQGFSQWLCRTLVAGLYPGGPYARKLLCVELLNAVLDTWPPGGATGGTAGGATDATAGTVVGDGGTGPSSSGSLPGGRKGARARGAGGAGAGRAPTGVESSSASAAFRPYDDTFLGPHTTSLLLNGVVDSWDRLRMGAGSALMKLPTPLPALSTPAELCPLLTWAAGLLWSPRQRESDAGARMLSLVFDKYVLGLNWRVELSPAVGCSLPDAAGTLSSAQAFLASLTALVEGQLEAARVDFGAACRRSLVHGPLLLLRYCINSLPWGPLLRQQRESAAAAAAEVGGARREPELLAWIGRLVGLLEQVADLALPVLARPLEGVSAEDVDADDDAGDGGGDGDGDGSDDGAQADGGGGGGLGPSAQVAMSACWTSIKEMSLVAGALANGAPLATATSGGSGSSAAAGSGGGSDAPTTATAVLTAGQLSQLGGLLLRLLLALKHNGAVEKATMGLSAIASRVLRSGQPELNSLPHSWLAALFAAMCARGQGRDEIVRRSAGLPYCLGALLQAEPHNTPKALLPAAMAALLQITRAAGDGGSNDGGGGSGGDDGAAAAAATTGARASLKRDAAAAFDSPAADAAAAPRAAGASSADNDVTMTQAAAQPAAGQQLSPLLPAELRASDLSALLDEQPWAAVHAFNCLRYTFNDAALAVDTSGFFAEGIQVCIGALGNRWWEVRNAATLCFTALVIRVVGFKNTGGGTTTGAGEAGKRAITGAEFFQRFPALHSFLLEELTRCVRQLDGGDSATTGDGVAAAVVGAPRAVPPGLYPVLILLSRLQPAAAPSASPGASAGEPLSPADFAPLVVRVGGCGHYAVRALSARALAPLVAPGEPLRAQLTRLLSAVPGGGGGDGGSGSRGAVNANARHGALLQLGALLTYNAPPPATAHSGGASDAGRAALLALCAARLPGVVAALCGGGAGGGGAACAAAALAAADSALAMAHTPAECCCLAGLAEAVSGACAAAVAATGSTLPSDCADGGDGDGGGLGAFADWADPGHSVMLKAAARTWGGHALVTSALAQLPSSSSSGEDPADSADPALAGSVPPAPAAGSPDAQAEGDAAAAACAELGSRLAACLASGSYDVRASVLKSLYPLLGALADAGGCSGGARSGDGSEEAGPGAGDNAPAARGASQASGSKPPLPSMAALSDKCAVLARVLVRARGGKAVASLSLRLQAMLWDTVAHEPTLKVRSRCMRALAQLHAASASLPQAPAVVPAGGASSSGAGAACSGASSDGAADDEAGVLSHLARVRALCDGARGVDAHAAALRCLGRALGSAVVPLLASSPPTCSGGGGGGATSAGSGSNAERLRAALDPQLARFSAEIERAAGADQADAMRAAAADALGASGILHLAAAGNSIGGGGSGGGGAALRGWLTALTLLQDEDADVRSDTAALCQRSAGAHGTQQLAGGGLFVEVVLRQVLRLLRVSFGGDARSRSALRGLVADASEAPPELLVPQAGGGHGTGLVRRLFDREADNQHEEPLLVAQLAAREHRELLGDAAAGDGGEVLEWLQVAADRLDGAAGALTQLQQPGAVSGGGSSGGGGWVGGLVNHPTTFPYLFRWLLVFWAAPPRHARASPEQVAALRARLGRALSAVCTPELSGPMVAVASEVAREWGVELPGSCSMATATAAALPGGRPADASAARAGASPWHALFLLDGGPCAQAGMAAL